MVSKARRYPTFFSLSGGIRTPRQPRLRGRHLRGCHQVRGCTEVQGQEPLGPSASDQDGLSANEDSAVFFCQESIRSEFTLNFILLGCEGLTKI